MQICNHKEEDQSAQLPMPLSLIRKCKQVNILMIYNHVIALLVQRSSSQLFAVLLIPSNWQQSRVCYVMYDINMWATMIKLDTQYTNPISASAVIMAYRLAVWHWNRWWLKNEKKYTKRLLRCLGLEDERCYLIVIISTDVGGLADIKTCNWEVMYRFRSEC